MKGLLALVVMAGLGVSFSGHANKHCVTKKNENGVFVTTCHHNKNHNIHRKKTCVTKLDANGKKITTCTGKTVKTH